MPDDGGPAGTADVPTDAVLPDGVLTPGVPLAGVPLPRRRAALPPEVIAALREAFEQEVLLRVPRLCRLAGTAPDAEALLLALRDAHSLASSAVVVGAADAARCARDLESALEHVRLDPHAPLPPEVLADIDLLAGLVEAWRRR